MQITKTQFVKLLLVVISTLTLTGCDPLRALIDKYFPPVTSVDQQYASVETNMQTIDVIVPHVGIHVEKQILMAEVPKRLKAAAEKVESDQVTVREFTPSISLVNQGIRVQADFAITISEHHVDLKGTFDGVASVSTELDKLYIRGAVKSLQLSSIKFQRKSNIGKKILAGLIAAILKSYIDNLNGAFLREPHAVDLRWGDTYTPKIKEMFRGSDVDIVSEPISVSRFLNKTAIRIGPKGITVMGELSGQKPDATPSEPPMPRRRTSSELARLFNEYDQKFEAKWATVFEPVDPAAAITASVAKSEIAQIFNEAVASPISVRTKLEIPKNEFNEKFEVKRGDIDCERTRRDFSYKRYERRSCNWSCRECVLGVCGDDPICKLNRAACNVIEEGKVAADNLKRETEYTAHKLQNERRVAECNLKREAIDFMALGRIKGHVSASGRSSMKFESIRFSPDLSELEIAHSGDIDAKLNARFEINPMDLGHVFLCVTDYRLDTSSDLDVTIPSTTTKIRFSAERRGQDLDLTARIERIPFSAKIFPSPLHVLLLDPRFQTLCPINLILRPTSQEAAFAALLGMFKHDPALRLLLLGQTSGYYGIDAITIPIKPIKFAIDGGPEQTATLSWNPKSITFTVPKADRLPAPGDCGETASRRTDCTRIVRPQR